VGQKAFSTSQLKSELGKEVQQLTLKDTLHPKKIVYTFTM